MQYNLSHTDTNNPAVANTTQNKKQTPMQSSVTIIHNHEPCSRSISIVTVSIQYQKRALFTQ